MKTERKVLTYICPKQKCPGDSLVEREFPIRWDRNMQGATAEYYRVLCPVCGSAMMPEELCLDGSGQFPNGILFQMFSRCPNAPECVEAHQYGPECEQDQIMPKCLFVLHRRLNELQEFAERQGAQLSGRWPARWPRVGERLPESAPRPPRRRGATGKKKDRAPA